MARIMRMRLPRMSDTINLPEFRVIALLSQEKFAEALDAAQAALADDPDNTGLHDLAGICAGWLGRNDLAETHWRRALVLDPAHVGILFNLGSLLIDSAPAEAERLLRDAEHLQPQSAPVHANLALICERQHRRAEAERHYRLAMQYDADTPALRFNFAGFLAAATEPERQAEAETLFREVIRADPQHFGALNNLGKLLFETGQIAAARTVYADAVRRHPEQIVARINLGNVLLHLDDPAAAREQFEAALAIEPRLVAAHQGLAWVFQRLGDMEQARHHRDLGFSGRALSKMDSRGAAHAVPLLVLASAVGGNLPWERLIPRELFDTTILAVEYFEAGAPLPPHRLIFNAIGDADLCPQALQAADRLVAHSEAPLINPPATVLETGRLDTVRRLDSIPDVVVPRTARLAKSDLCAPTATEKLLAAGLDFPLLLRAPGYHGGNFFVRVDAPDGLASAATGLPGDSLLAIEFLASRQHDGLHEKFRVMCINGRLYPLHLAMSHNWKIHYYNSETVADPACRKREAEFLGEPEAYLGSQAWTALQAIGDTMGLDYCGIDFGLDEHGRILLFEANATMTLACDEATPQPCRRTATDKALAAVRAMMSARCQSS